MSKLRPEVLFGYGLSAGIALGGIIFWTVLKIVGCDG